MDKTVGGLNRLDDRPQQADLEHRDPDAHDEHRHLEFSRGGVADHDDVVAQNRRCGEQSQGHGHHRQPEITNDHQNGEPTGQRQQTDENPQRLAGP